MIHSLLGRLGPARSGAVLLELAVILPVLLIALLGGMETARLVMIHQKLDRAAATMSDLVARSQTVSAADVDQMFAAARNMVEPFELGPSGRVIVSSVNRDGGGDTLVAWQLDGAGTLAVASAVGSAGGDATLPDGFTLAPDENVIVAEVFYDFQPWLMASVFPPRIVRHQSLRRPRFGSLAELEP